MICTGYDGYLRSLRVDKHEVLWRCILSNGKEAWSDFDRPEYDKDPWTRLKIYCNNNNVDILEVRVNAVGIPEQTVYINPKGMDGFFITRGITKDLYTNEGADGITYKYLAFGKLSDAGDQVFVKKFYWPECKFSETLETRAVTEDNMKLMYFKRKTCGENCECQENEPK
jgi:hypothetical protein